jgi:hypothetical protein
MKKIIILILLLTLVVACTGQKFNIKHSRIDEIYDQNQNVPGNQLQQLTEQGQSVKVRPFYGRTGDVAGSLDSLAEATLADGDLSLVFDISNDTIYHYRYDADDATDAEDNPNKIFPDDRTGGTGTHMLMFTALNGTHKCAVIEDLVSTDDDIPLGSLPKAVTLVKFWCKYKGTGSTPATIQFQDASGNNVTSSAVLTCVAHTAIPTEGAGLETFDGGNNLIAYESLMFDVTNTPAPGTDTYEICWEYTIDD